MQRRYSEMNRTELQQEMARLLTERKQAQLPSQAAILEQKYYMAKSYTLAGGDFPPGVYEVTDQDGRFRLEFINGVMAWGTTEDGKEACFPIAMLRKTRD